VIDLPQHLLYVCEQTSRPVIEHLSFRNRLRNDPAVAAAYAKLKTDLAQRFRNDRERYTEAKTDFIRRILVSSPQPATCNPQLIDERHKPPALLPIGSILISKFRFQEFFFVSHPAQQKEKQSNVQN
jgi:GrpB protein